MQVTRTLLKQSRQTDTDPTRQMAEYVPRGQLQKALNEAAAADPEDVLSESLEEVLEKALVEEYMNHGSDDTYAIDVSCIMSMVRTPVFLKALVCFWKHLCAFGTQPESNEIYRILFRLAFSTAQVF